jgi:hypothetical protein
MSPKTVMMGRDLCAVLGVDATKRSKIAITCEAGEPVWVAVTYLERRDGEFAERFSAWRLARQEPV